MTSLTVAAAARPHLFLVAAFALYKTALLLIAAGTLALDDYDTSSARFSELAPGGSAPGALAGKLLRWDAVYFIHTAQERGYVYEQSWAFGIGFSAVVAGATSALRAVISAAAPGEVVVGVAVAHAAHLAAVLALYRLTVALGGERGGPGGSTLHLVPALLHVVSPAGIFLSAPYAESSFAALSFAGALLFVLGGQRPSGSLARSSLVVLSGVVFGVSATFRSNGALSGLLPLGEAVHLCMRAWASDRLVSWRRVVDVGALGISGLALAAGFAAPQVAAWMRYCSDGRTLAEPAEWCADMPPSIYGYVQRRYWNVGFLRYWTPNQIPLFLLAGPMLALLIRSGVAAMRDPQSVLPSSRSHSSTSVGEPEKASETRNISESAPEKDSRTLSPPSRTHPDRLAAPPENAPKDAPDDRGRAARAVRALAAAQTLLAILALTSYHVQIINRISSGYAVWYWWTAARVGAEGGEGRIARAVVIGGVVYGFVQAALFAAFMPPA